MLGLVGAALFLCVVIRIGETAATSGCRAGVRATRFEASVLGAQHAAPLHVHAFIANNLKWRAVIQWWFLG